jgi:hypothetical protein
MRQLLALATTAAALLGLAGTAAAEPPLHDSFSIHLTDVDTQTCSFPVVRDWVFTQHDSAYFDSDGTITKLLVHQSNVGTLTGNGVTLRMNIRENTMVDFVGGIAVTAKHVGQLDYIGGSQGQPVFHRTGLELRQVVNGLDGPLIARHGLRDDLDPAEFCAAFA